jgi:hypothetical protein
MFYLIAQKGTKKPCFKYLNNDHCVHGDQCRSIHKSKLELNYLDDLNRLGLINDCLLFHTK